MKESKLLNCITISTLIYGFICQLQEDMSQDIGPDIEDYFIMSSGDDFHSPEILGLRAEEQAALRDNFIVHCGRAEITLPEEIANGNAVFLYRAYMSKVSEELFDFKKLFSEYMWKEL